MPIYVRLLIASSLVWSNWKGRGINDSNKKKLQSPYMNACGTNRDETTNRGSNFTRIIPRLKLGSPVCGWMNRCGGTLTQGRKPYIRLQDRRESLPQYRESWLRGNIPSKGGQLLWEYAAVYRSVGRRSTPWQQLPPPSGWLYFRYYPLQPSFRYPFQSKRPDGLDGESFRVIARVHRSCIYWPLWAEIEEPTSLSIRKNARVIRNR